MGQTLTNGVFLPDEGERNCYTGLAENWRALDYLIGGYNVHVDDLVIHVSQADRDKWDTVTTKANDADAVHKSGAETIAGLKTFSDLMSIDGDYLGNEASTNQRTNFQLRSNRDTAGQSAAFITRFRQNRAQGALQTGDLQKIGFDIMENEARTNNVFDIQCTNWSGNIPTQVNFVSSVTDYSFGRSNNPCKINNLNPGSLSLPNLSSGVDISGYITDLNGNNSYTPSVNGYVSIGVSSSSTTAVYIYEDVDGWGMSGRSITNNTYLNITVLSTPVIANKALNIEVRSTSSSSIIWAKFYPCQGNV